MMHRLKISLVALASSTLAVSAWLLLMTVVLHHPDYGRQAVVVTTFMAQSALTVMLLSPLAPPSATAWLRAVVLTGAAGIFYAGWSIVATQLSRGGFDPGQASGRHFEGYALVLGVALVVQATLTAVTLLAARPSHQA